MNSGCLYYCFYITGHVASAKAVDLPPDTCEKILLKKLEEAHATNPKFRTIIDRQYKQSLDSYNNDINKYGYINIHQ